MRKLPDGDDLGQLCYARACIAKREAHSLYCAQHWSMLSSHMQRSIITAFGHWRKSPGAQHARDRLMTAARAAYVCLYTAETDSERKALAVHRKEIS